MGALYPPIDSWWKTGPINYQGRTLAQWVQSLFGGGVPGVLYVPSPSTCFQDAALTIPAAVSDPVGGLLDLSGNGNNATQATADARPTLEQDGSGNYYLDFDGTNDFLLAVFDIEQPIDRISGITQGSWTLNDQVFGGGTAGSAQLLQVSSSPTLGLYSGSGGPSRPVPLLTPAVITERHNGAQSRIAVDDGAYDVSNAGTTLPGGISIGGSRVGAACSDVDFYGTFMRGDTAVLTDSQVALVRRYIGSLCGVAF